MTTIFIVIILIACFVLGFFILIQKPKGGGLNGSFGSVGTQVMGVQKSGDIMEKGTWYTMAIIAILSIGSVFTLGLPKEQKAQEQQSKQQPANGQQGQAQGTTPAPAQ